MNTKRKITNWPVMKMSEIEVPRGLAGVIVDTTAIATTDQTGNLVYRGYRAVDLARKHSFSETAYLIVYGEMPSRSQHSEFEEKILSISHVEDRYVKLIQLLKEKNVLSSMRTVTSALQMEGSDRMEQLLQIAAKFPGIASHSYRIYRNLDIIHSSDKDISRRIYQLSTGRDDPERAKFLEKILIMYMEHEFNASTFALRVAASTGTDPASAINAALSTLKGPLHGGANSEILSYLLKFRNEEEGIDFVRNRLENKQLVMGFGHRVYKTKDPRAQFIKEELRKLIGETKRFQIADAIETYMWEQKNLPANLDFYGAFYLNEVGIDEPLYTPLFAVARVFGWVAHYMEQNANNKLIRPLSRYIGNTGRES